MVSVATGSAQRRPAKLLTAVLFVALWKLGLLQAGALTKLREKVWSYVAATSRVEGLAGTPRPAPGSSQAPVEGVDLDVGQAEPVRQLGGEGRLAGAGGPFADDGPRHVLPPSGDDESFATSDR
jgi:hypothetical protein